MAEIMINGDRRNRKFLRRFEPFDPTGVRHRGKDQEVSRQNDHTGLGLTVENPSRVLPAYPRVEETMDRSPPRALVQTETRQGTMPEIDRSAIRESYEPESRGITDTESTQSSSVNSPRRSTRSTRGQTSRFKDYETDF